MEVDRRLRMGQFERQGGLADLPRAKRRHRRSLGQSRHERGDESAGNRPCNDGARLQKCKVARRGSVVTAWMKFIHAMNRQARGGTEGFLQELLARRASAVAAASNVTRKAAARA